MNKMKMKQQRCMPEIYSFISEARDFAKYDQNIIFEYHNTSSIFCAMHNAATDTTHFKL